MKSCLYECDVMHHRLRPKEHRFTARTFMFYLDLDEIDEVCRKVRGVSRNRFNIFNFRDDEHLSCGGKDVKDNIIRYLQSKGVAWQGGRIMLLTTLRTLGYSFNPVSFYYCFDQNDNPVCVVPEIGNTFRELKPYFIGTDKWRESRFRDELVKYFYISPFTNLDISMRFNLRLPDEHLNIRIDDIEDDTKLILTTLMGRRRELTSANVWWCGLKYPLITLKVITLIHWHALRLYLKKIQFHRKESNPHLQREVNRVVH